MRKLAKARYGLAALASLAAGLAVAAEPLHGWKFDSGVTLRETWTDNVGVTATNAKSDFITEIAPYITAKKRGADLKVDFRYNMQNLFYLSDSERNKVHHQLAATANAELYDKHLFLDVNASASQQVTNPLGATSVTTTSATGNVTDVYSLTVSPYWQHRFGTYANLLARYSRSQTASSGNAYSDSGTDAVNLSLNSGSAFSQFLWGVNFSEQSSDYTDRPDVKLTTQSATVGYALTRRLRANFTKGYEEHSFQSNTGNPQRGAFWNASFSWAPSQRSNFEIGYGDHYYGGSWFGKLASRGEFLSWDASYSQSISTPTGNSSNFDGFVLDTFRINPDGSIYIAGTSVQGTILTNSVYLDKSFRAGLTYKNKRNDVGVSLSHSRRIGQETVLTSGTSVRTGCTIYSGSSTCTSSPSSINDSDTAFNRVTTVGADIFWNRRLSPQTRGHLRLGVSRTTYPELNRQDDMRNIELGLSRNFARSMTGNLTVRHQERDSNQANSDTSENAVSASVTIPF